MKNLILFSSLLLLFSCGKNKVFEKYEKFDNYDWAPGKIVKFDVPIEDTSAYYKIIVPVRHTDNYPYDGLLINFSYDTPNSENHTERCKMNFRDNDGKFKGDVAGDIWDESTVLFEKIKFNAIGIYKFEITNNMQKIPTEGIMELGLRIEKVK